MGQQPLSTIDRYVWGNNELGMFSSSTEFSNGITLNIGAEISLENGAISFTNIATYAVDGEGKMHNANVLGMDGTFEIMKVFNDYAKSQNVKKFNVDFKRNETSSSVSKGVARKHTFKVQ